MKVKCPHCNQLVKVDHENDCWTKAWNFDGVECELEVRFCCEKCAEPFSVMFGCIVKQTPFEIIK